MTSIKKYPNNDTQFREFFYNKETPNYWKFFFFLLEKVFLKALLGFIIIAIIFIIPSIVNTASSYRMKSKEQEAFQKAQLEEKVIQRNKDESVYVKQLLKTLDNTVILESIRNVYKQADTVHLKALENYKKAPDDRNTSRPSQINENYKFLKKSLDEDFKNVLKVSSILELNNEGAASQLTLTEIQQAIEIIRKYTITGKIKTNRFYMDLKTVADALD